MRNFSLKNVSWLILDVDGVLTDGKIIYDSNGNELKFFCVKDGMGLHILNKIGVNLAIITGRVSSIVEKRAIELDFKEIIQNSISKIDSYNYLKEKYGFKDEEVAYIGDDYNDYELLKTVGFPITVPKSPKILKDISIYITKNEGGDGAVREVVDMILEDKGYHGEKILNLLKS